MARDRLNAALSGDLVRFMAEEEADLKAGVTRGVHKTAKEVRDALRDDVIRGGLGKRLAKSWRLNTYPARGKDSLRSAGEVYTKAPVLIGAFDEGATIRSKDGFWLAIPTDSAPKRGLKGDRISPSNWNESRFGPLRFVFRRTGPSLLVADSQRLSKGKRGGYALSKSKKALSTGTGLHTVPMFLLYRQTRLKKRLDVARVADSASRYLAENIDDELTRVSRLREKRR